MLRATGHALATGAEVASDEVLGQEKHDAKRIVLQAAGVHITKNAKAWG